MVQQMKQHNFNAVGAIPINVFLCSFKLACITSRIHEEAAICLFYFFMKKSASSALHTGLASKHKNRTRLISARKNNTLTKYSQIDK